MKTRKTVIAVLAAVLLISAALIVGCISQFDGVSVEEREEDNYQAPAGKALIKFKISDGRARTIMPTADVESMYFKFIFIDSDTITGPHTINWPTTGTVEYSGNISIPLDPETYTVSINAYSDSDGNNLITAWSSGSTTYQVDTGTSTPIDAYLEGDLSGGQGKFNYHITIPDLIQPAITELDNYVKTLTILESDDLAVATLVLDDGSDTPVDNPIELEAADGINFNTDKIILDAGQYYVYLTLSADHCQDRVIKNVMYIYRNLPTNYGTEDESIEVEPPVQSEFTVRVHSTVEPDNGGTLTGVDILDVPCNNAVAATNPFNAAPEHSQYTWAGWWADSAHNTAWNWNTKIFKDTNVYAYWQANTGAGITIYFDIVDGGEDAIISDAGNPVGSFSWDDIAGDSPTVTLIFTTELTSAKWYLDGVLLTATQTTIPNDTLTISKTSNAGILNRLASGTHYINLIGIGSKEESAQIKFTVNNN